MRLGIESRKNSNLSLLMEEQRGMGEVVLGEWVVDQTPFLVLLHNHICC